MTIASVGSNPDILQQYPELQFLLHYETFIPYLLTGDPVNALHPDGHSLHFASISQEIELFLSKSDLENCDILYIYGLGLGYHFTAVRDWLAEKRERRLIFLEDDLGAIDALLRSQNADDLFSHPQVAVHFLSQEKKLGDQLEEIAHSYPCDRIEVACIGSYYKRKKRRFQQLHLKLLRQSSVSHAMLTESLYSHKMLANLLRNIKRWHGSFFAGGLKGKFRNIPAIICGAGPSLQASIPLLKELEDRALIIAGGSTIAALSNQGIHPHLGLALDPNPEEFGRLKVASSFETPLIYATRLQAEVLNVLNGPLGYLISDTGGACERHFEREMEILGEPIGPDLGPEAFSVTTLAIALAVEMGCNPILLDGVDLAYTGMKRYAEGVLPSSKMHLGDMRAEKKAPERLLKRKGMHGHYVHTLVKWVMESDCIASYAKNHPEFRFINVSKSGLGFPGIPNIPLLSMQQELQNTWDLRAFVHAEIQQLQMPPLKDKIEREMRTLEESLIRLSSIADAMIDELERVFSLDKAVNLPTGRMAILEIDFQEEKAFESLFPTLGPALDKLLARAFYTSPHATEEENQRVLLEGKMAKWKYWKEMIAAEIAVFRECAAL